MQGMGYVTGLVIHPLAPHDIYIRTDVGGAYRYDRAAERWLPLMDRFGTAESAFGVESIAVDPNDANTVYAAGEAPGIVSGVLQVNAQIPFGAHPGPSVPVVIKAGGVASQPGVTVAVK